MKLSQLTCGLALAFSLSPMLSQAAPATMNSGKCTMVQIAANLENLVGQLGWSKNSASVSTANWSLLTSSCEVTGKIKPKDVNAPDINFSVSLPANWNDRALLMGGGGLDGFVVPAVLLQIKNSGFVIFTNDSGHQLDLVKGLSNGDLAGGSFAMNDEALNNFAGDSLKKTRDAVNQLINIIYGKAPKYWYAIGGSEGGREVLTLAQRWPEDWDGISSATPALNFADMNRAFIRRLQAWKAPGGALGLGELDALSKSVMSTCDALDGVEDQLVSNIDACRKAFDPMTATRPSPWPLPPAPLHCPPRVSSSLLYACLSDAQIKTVQVVINPIEFAEPSNFGARNYPGYKPNSNFASGLLINQGLLADPYYKYFVTRNSSADYMDMDTLSLSGPFKERFQALEKLFNTSPDLNKFFKKGGKILLTHGTDDQVISPQSTRNYYEAVVQNVATSKSISASEAATAVKENVRFYEFPGGMHGGAVNLGTWDDLKALKDWVENGKAPVNPILSGGSRDIPLCEYPTWPKYNGSGDVKAASSFTCATN
ncbi:tannase/feruloyl esterase family alpha/beta hydrolase [Variovorax sp. ZS18.2.2]|uniref:tannase/feruloyl esterase family alpha/beta hydrolase n=1 Tax=Variovorax sp. ZS18.2.2 TaxID=2971255 RepID=UPI00215101B0|nr:tannase/feruloyl esterase family alpha/beta hydrolase [Variovorax sp. ZS18.2.2]MCR6480509.1 tannase/feruloyl esterase family alpha/beta hydrolase [Variovorax sp. ZS18.2.2]